MADELKKRRVLFRTSNGYTGSPKLAYHKPASLWPFVDCTLEPCVLPTSYRSLTWPWQKIMYLRLQLMEPLPEALSYGLIERSSGMWVLWPRGREIEVVARN